MVHIICQRGLIFACSYSVEWSPFNAKRLACSEAQNFGIVGTGKQIVLDFSGELMIDRLLIHL